MAEEEEAAKAKEKTKEQGPVEDLPMEEDASPSEHAFPIVEALAFAKAALWPIVAFVAVLQLGGPIGQVIASLPTVATRVESIDYGNFKLNLSSTSERPPRAVRRALETLTEADIERLMVMPTNGRSPYCPDVLPVSDETRRLIAGGVFEVVDTTLATPQCPEMTRLSGTGVRLREYIMELVFSEVIVPVAPSQPDTPTEDEAPNDAKSDL